MTVDDNIFSNGAVGVAFLDPKKTGTVHLTVNPETGAIVLAEAHPIRLRSSGVNTDILNELGNTATALISEFISNYLGNSRKKNGSINVTDPAFKTLLGQTVSGLDQMLVDTVTHGQGDMVAYQMDESRKVKSPPRTSLLNRITNSLEAIVYYNGGIHISHRGESQQYLVGSRVQKLTQDYVAGGLFSKIGAIGDFIPEIQTNSVAMNESDHLVFLSREAALSSFPLNNLKLWMEDADPREQAQRVAQELKKLGKERGCVVVFSPGWQGSQTDDIMANGMFSLNNLGNLEKEAHGRVSVIPNESAPEAAEASLAGPSAAPKKNQHAGTNKRPAKRNSSLKLKARTSRAAEKLTSLSPGDPFEPRRSHRRSIIESEIHSISQKVMEQLPDQLDLLETRLQDDFKGRLSGMRRDILAQTSREVSKNFEKWVEDELPQLEDRLEAQLQEELADLEMRMGSMLGKGMAGLRAEINDIKSQIQQRTNGVSLGDDAAAGGNTDEIDVQEMQQLDPNDIMFSTLPGAIFGATQKPESPPSAKPPVAKPLPVTPVKNTNRTLPAPAAYETLEPDEESTTITSHDNISEFVTAQTEANRPDASANEPVEAENLEYDASISSVDNTDSIFPAVKPAKGKTVAAILIAIVIVAGGGAFLFSPWSPLNRKASSEQKTADTTPSNTNNKLQPKNTSAAAPLVQEPRTKAQSPTAAIVPETPETTPAVAQTEIAKSPYELTPDDNLNSAALYEEGLSLYRIGDSKKDGRTHLNGNQQREVLLSALRHLTAAAEKSDNAPKNLWYVKGRTEYNLTKIEKSKKQRLQFAEAALASYGHFLESKKSISKAKSKTIKRNQKRLKKIVQKSRK